MTAKEIARLRSAAQRLAVPLRGTPASMVGWLGAVQAQDYPLAKWSVAQRLAAGTTAAVERAVAAGLILRTHVLRPTWHFVPRDDLRWMQELTAPRVRALAAYNDRRNGIDAAMIAKSTRAITNAIERRGHLTRAEIADVLTRVGIRRDAWLVSELVIHAELSGVVCSGVPRGREQTYALLEERAPRSRRLDRDEALGELASRYFRGHGPATAKDFRWWSGLDAPNAARAIDVLGRRLERIDGDDGRVYFIARGARATRSSAPVSHLVQPFDEIAVAYTESRDLIDPSGAARKRGWSLLLRAALVDGEIVGRWSRTAGGKKDDVRVELLRCLTAGERTAVDQAIERFRRATSPRADRTDSDPNQSRSTRRRSRSS
jgi:hypothetical protein